MAAAPSPRWTTCNVLAPAGEGHLLWQFTRRGDTAVPVAEIRLDAGAPLPADRVRKTFRHTWQPRLNIAWLPADKVYVRVVDLPPGDPSEVPALVEFQLEKLSPLPVAQCVWTCELVGQPAPGKPLTAVVVIADRATVEARLQTLEAAGYRPDRLELPILRELLDRPAPREGISILAERAHPGLTCLAAWWAEGRLRHLSLARFADEARAGDALADALRRTAWAAEVEGWLPDAPPVTLWAPAEVAAHLEPALRDFAGAAVTVHPRRSDAELAASCAIARAQLNLVPAEVLVRYRQEFVDRLWLRALGAVALVYVFLILGYLAWLSVLDYQKMRVDQQIALVTDPYKKALQLKARLEVLQKFAALDCWKAAAEHLPETMTLNSITFQRGRKFGITGTVPVDQQGRVTEYNLALSRAEVRGRPLFSQVTTKSIQGPGPGRPDQPATWSLECEINRRDLP